MNRRKIIVASGNINKIKEIKKILDGLNLDIISKNEVGLKDIEVIEDKDTLEGNAIKKAKEISELVDGIVLADDTGLFVDKLNGEPGVYSARYAGEDANDLNNNKKLLKKLEGLNLEDRTAEFRTVIAIVLEDKTVKTLTGVCKGKIALERTGNNDFGYDPLFIPDGYKETFAEMPQKIKNDISHRANALKKLRLKLEEVLDNE
ncbi:RdgB/HAM1 family non-canonical purine NTP pyrophosphatase [Senegalia massiliensis]|uniref:dITP/XTP pyrophosphatase n=1 Tax=Senegalia massiliensis TaxID=1720316 RepID=A0A845R1C5_9CLOT|nr:RdgB/HAM1 family non-canonical purine NTP pyrophosphatase [Senegalia massiliensis]NBI07222.1 RdgB/HAM1 family non-canonical purine NTP pyrophosphatase [Senegalia massiliensis]